MKSLLSVLRFEWHYHRQRPVSYLFASLIFGHGCWQALLIAQRNPDTEATAWAYLAMASPGVVLATIAILLAGQSLTKDWEYKAAPYLHTLPINSRLYLAGRFLGTLLAILTLAIFYPLGILTAFVCWYPADPLPWLALVDGFVRLLSQPVFIIASLAFSASVFTRSIHGAYAVLFLAILYFLLTDTPADGTTPSALVLLLDPFGSGMIRESIAPMNQAEPTAAVLSFSDELFINRLLWLGLALGLLAQAETAFSFQDSGRGRSMKTRRANRIARPAPLPETHRPVRRSFDGWSRVRLLARLAKLTVWTLIRQPVFGITTGLLVVLTVLLATILNQNAAFPELPITPAMTALRLPMGVFISLFLLVMTGECLFQEQTVGLAPIVDALPQPTFVSLVAKLLALAGLAALLTVTLFLTSVGIQIGSRFGDIDWSLYARDLTLDGFLRYCQLIALGAFVAALVNRRIVSHLVNLLLFGLLWLGYQAGPVGVKPYLYSFLPGSGQYSTLTGYGADEPVRLPTHLMWWGLAGILLTLTMLIWNRGIPVGLIDRIKMGKHRFARPYKLTLALFVAWFGIGLWSVQPRSERAMENFTTRVGSHSQYVDVPSLSGKTIRIRVLYHDRYQVSHIMRAAAAALHRGEQIFGAYPQTALLIGEVPPGSAPVGSAPGRVFISEKEGWTADPHEPAEGDYIDYLIAREVFNQWLTQRMHPIRQPGDGFLRRTLADYLALCLVGRQYGPERLKQRLAQRTALYNAGRNQTTKLEEPLLRSSGNDALERGRGALMLSSIGQVWSDTALSHTIGQFYRLAVQQPTSATASAFASHLNQQLPDSLRYLTTYLTDRLWFSFSIGQIANLPNGLSVEIFPKKWQDDNRGHRQLIPINDLIPLTVLNRSGAAIYTTLVRPEPDRRWVRLPPMANARIVLIDPLGTWPEATKTDNSKIF